MGKSGLEVSAMGLGCMTIGNDYSDESKQNAIRIIRRAYDLGVTMFDTAEVYGGALGNNERLLGEALKPIRDKVVIATKCGMRTEGGRMQINSDPKVIRQSIEGSLKRLQTDYIDLYYIHRVDPMRPIEEAADTMAQLHKEGKLLHWGISEPSMDTLRRANAVFPVAVIESEYNMMWREPEQALFPTLEELGVGLVPFRPLARGFLSDASDGAYLKGAKNTRFDEKNLPANLALKVFVQKLAREKRITAAQFALAWLAAQRPYIVPIPGTSKMERMEENVRAAEIRFTQAEMDTVNSLLEQIRIIGERYDPESDSSKSVRK